MTDDPDIVRSPLSRSAPHDGITVQVEIYKLAGTDGWILELIDADGGSTVWQDTFASDTAAFAEFRDGVQQLGLAKLIDPDEDDVATVHYLKRHSKSGGQLARRFVASLKDRPTAFRIWRSDDRKHARTARPDGASRGGLCRA